VGEVSEVRAGSLEEGIERLRELSDKAEAGESGARAELRRAVEQASPATIAEASSVGRRAEGMLIKTIAAGEPLIQETLRVRLRHMRTQIAGENPSPLEVLLAERVVSGWLLVEVLEALLCAQYRRNTNGETVRRASPSYVLQMSRILESATRRNMQAIQTLARVRKLQANTPGIQVNTQINLGRS
jgi:hypothetical protein